MCLRRSCWFLKLNQKTETNISRAFLSVLIGPHASSQRSPALTEVAWKWPLITVTEFDVDLQGGKRRARHVAQRTFDVVHCQTNKSELYLNMYKNISAVFSQSTHQTQTHHADGHDHATASRLQTPCHNVHMRENLRQ